MLTKGFAIMIAPWLMLGASGCQDAADPSPELRITDVYISNAVLGLRTQPNGSVVERKEANIQTIYMDVVARDTGSWTTNCKYELVDESGNVVSRGDFDLSGGDGTITNVAAPITFDIRGLAEVPTAARVECPLET